MIGGILHRIRYCNQRVALLERARFCHWRGLELRRLAEIHARRHYASKEPHELATLLRFRHAARVQFNRRDELLGELRAITPRRPHHA